MTHVYRSPVLAILILLIVLLGASGCSAAGPTWVDDGTNYTIKSVENVLDVADISAQAKLPATDAVKLRHAALTSLRKQSDSAARAANLITATFDPATRSVPVYVESASLDGTPVLIVVEATGPKTGTLNMKRLWVLRTDGTVILARSR